MIIVINNYLTNCTTLFKKILFEFSILFRHAKTNAYPSRVKLFATFFCFKIVDASRHFYIYVIYVNILKRNVAQGEADS